MSTFYWLPAEYNVKNFNKHAALDLIRFADGDLSRTDIADKMGLTRAAEKRLKGGGVAMRLIPVPRHLTSDCGLAIRIPLAERDRAREVLRASRLLPVSVHFPREDGGYDPGKL